MDKIVVEDLLKFRFLSGIRISPDGDLAAFIVKQGRLEENDYSSDIYLVELETGNVRRLTSSGKDGPFAWSADSRTIVFVSHRSGGEEESPLYRIAVAGGEAEKIGTIPHKVEALEVLPDGRILYTARVPVGEGQEDKDYQVLDEIPFWSNGVGFTNKRRVHLFVFDLGTGEGEELVSGTFNVASFDVAGTRIAYTGKDFEDKAPLTDELWVMDIQTNARELLSKDELCLSEPRFLGEGRIVVMATDMRPYGLSQNRELMACDVATRGFTCLTPGWDHSTGNSVNSDVRHGGGPTLRVDQDAMYCVVTEDDSSYLERVAADGQIARVIATPGSIDCFDVRDGKIVYVALRRNWLQEVYMIEDGAEVRLSSLNEAAVADKSVSSPTRFSVTGSDGTDLAFVIRPPDVTAGKKYPAILAIHGGPKTAYGETFIHEMQVLAGQGYIIVFGNPRGSAGRGNEFADIRGKYGAVDYDDLMAILDAAIAAFPEIEASRLGVMGGSYGGFMTNWTVPTPIGSPPRVRSAPSPIGSPSFAPPTSDISSTTTRSGPRRGRMTAKSCGGTPRFVMRTRQPPPPCSSMPRRITGAGSGKGCRCSLRCATTGPRRALPFFTGRTMSYRAAESRPTACAGCARSYPGSINT